DQDVEVAELLGDLLDHRPGLLRVGEVGLRQDARPAKLANVVGHFLGLFLVALVVDGNLRTLAGQLQGDRPPDPTRRPGDQGSLPVQTTHCKISLWSKKKKDRNP